MYPRQDCGDNRECYRQSYISSAIAAAASASASAAAVAEDPPQALQDSGNPSNSNAGASQFISTIELESSTSIPLTTTGAKMTSSSDTFTAAVSSTQFHESSQSYLSSFPSPGMITATRPAWGGGGPFRPASTTSSAAATSFTDSPANSGPSLSAEASHPGTTKKTALIAGVVVPIILIMAGGLLLSTCLRRRKRSAAAASAAAPGLLEKISHKRLDSDAAVPAPLTVAQEDDRPSTPQRLPNPHLMIPSSQNPAQNPTYFTGLDTFSVHSAATSEDPPPPYRAHSVLSQRSAEPHRATSLVPLSPVSPLTPQQEQDFLSPFSDTHAMPPPPPPPPLPSTVTRSPSARSFASTLYSSNASVYEARPARRSVGNAYVVPGSLGASPFADPEEGERRGP